MSEVKVNKISPRTNCGTTQLGDAGDSIAVAACASFKTKEVKDASGNLIISRCGSNITIGSSGSSVALACGATQSGFGRSGSVNWDTTAKTASFTAVSGNGYFINTTSGAITVTLPASPSAGDIVSIADYAGTAATNNITIARNGSNFEGGTSNGEITVNRQSVTLVYVDGTQGWVPTSENDSSFQQPLFTIATGGTITTCGNYKIHTFTGPGTFCVSQVGNCVGGPGSVDYLVVAGGGGANGDQGAGGGAGGYRESSGTSSGCYSRSPLGACVSALPVTASPYPITVGGGGSPGPGGSSGSNSIFSTITSAGGGLGPSLGGTGGSGGSGGGGGGANSDNNTGGSPGTGNTPPVSPPQGQNGGQGGSGSGGGGGGATSTGSNGGVAPRNTSNGGPGGNGATSSITTSPVTRSGGGGGAGFADSNTPGGSGGSGGGGNGAPGTSSGGSGSANTGGGGGGGGYCSGHVPGGAGGSGIVVIRYKYQ